MSSYIPTHADLTLAIRNGLLKAGFGRDSDLDNRAKEIAEKIKNIFGTSDYIIDYNRYSKIDSAVNKEERAFLRSLEDMVSGIIKEQVITWTNILIFNKKRESTIKNWRVGYIHLNSKKIQQLMNYTPEEQDSITVAYENAFADEDIWNGERV